MGMTMWKLCISLELEVCIFFAQIDIYLLRPTFLIKFNYWNRDLVMNINIS